MSGILAVIAEAGPPLSAGTQARLLAQVAPSAYGGVDAPRSELWCEDGVSLGVSRAAWEISADFSGPELVVHDADCAIVADAALYHADDLRRQLAARGVQPSGRAPSHLIAAAYRAWGARCAEWLEGDFSFVLWDRRRRTLVGARDFAGRRPLFYASLPGGTLVLASSIAAILRHPACSHELDVVAIAEAAAGYVSPSAATCHASVSQLHAGRTLVRSANGAVRIDTHWEPPTFQSGSARSFGDAADELRALLCAAVGERLARAGTTAVWMSGGRDSTAVFAAGSRVIRDRALPAQLVPVSISYPEEDSGCEDATIRAVAARWDATVRWVSIAHIPLFDVSSERAALRDEPFSHFFAGAQHALARATSDIGAHVALDGVGGDQLFLRSLIFLSDLLRSGRWLALRRAWRDTGLSGSGLRSFVHWAVQPMLPTSLMFRAGALRGGRPLRGWLQRRLPPWIAPGFAKAHGVAEFAAMLPERRRGERAASLEARSYFTDPFFSTMFRLGTSCARSHGVEIRSPLYDRRIIAFAATRPRSDDAGDADGKRLLRHAMRELLPDEVVAPREQRTGTPRDYVGTAIRELAERVVPDIIGRPTALAELGIVDVAAFERARASIAAHEQSVMTLPFFATVQAELWLRAHAGAQPRWTPTFESTTGTATAIGAVAAEAVTA